MYTPILKYDPNSKHAELDYVYDANGNLVTDLNKKIGTYSDADPDPTTGAGITYNHLNLPVHIVMQDATGNPKGTIQYVYDAAGIKLKKIVAETNATVHYNGSSYTTNITTETTYLGGAVFESKSYSHSDLAALNSPDQLQFIGHEEGRIRLVAATDFKPVHFAYDYFVEDHLGNVRMVLTDEQQQASYFATMELGTGNAIRNKENQLFSGIETTDLPVSSIPGGFPSPNPLTQSNDYVAQVSGSGQKIGPGIVLKVMSGDTVNIRVDYLYKSDASPGSNINIINDILTSFASGIVGTSAWKYQRHEKRIFVYLREQ